MTEAEEKGLVSMNPSLGSLSGSRFIRSPDGPTITSDVALSPIKGFSSGKFSCHEETI
jgi:hypothetical protein